MRCYDPTTAASSSGSLVNLLNSRRVQRSYDYYKPMLTKATYRPLFKISDSLFILKNIKDSAYVYFPNGELQRTFSIQHHKSEDWQERLLFDRNERNFNPHTDINLVSN